MRGKSVTAYKYTKRYLFLNHTLCCKLVSSYLCTYRYNQEDKLDKLNHCMNLDVYKFF